MPIRKILKDGVTIMYQAVVGNGGKGLTKSFSVAKLGNRAALHAATEEARRKEASYVPPPRKDMRLNSEEATRLCLEYMASEIQTGLEISCAVATHGENGVVCNNKFSTNSNGLLQAIERAEKARESGAGITISWSPAELEAIMRRAFDKPHMNP